MEGDQEIDAIDKDSLLALLNVFLNSAVEMDVADEKKLSNQAQRIIYKSIYDKFNGLRASKSRFKDESDRKYLKAIQQYSESATPEQ